MEPLPYGSEELCDAFAIVDMSYDFVADDGKLSVGKRAQAIVPRIVELADKYLKAGKKVVIFNDQHKRGQPATVAHFKAWPEHNVEGEPGQKLYGDLQRWYEENGDKPGVYYFGKNDYNGFVGTEAKNVLRTVGVKSIAFAGVCTDICVFLSVAGASSAHFDTAVYKSGCATFTENGQTFIGQMALCFKTRVLE